MNRPILLMPKTKIEVLHDIISIVVLVSTFVYLYSKCSFISNTIPIHFKTSGEVDGWGSKYFLTGLPLLSLLLLLLFTILRKFPHKFNYLVEITPENAYRQYLNARLLTSWVQVEIVIMFSYFQWEFIHAAMGNSSSPVVNFLAFIFVIVGTSIIFIIRMFRKV
jgi:uncharacterized membrane protein